MLQCERTLVTEHEIPPLHERFEVQALPKVAFTLSTLFSLAVSCLQPQVFPCIVLFASHDRLTPYVSPNPIMHDVQRETQAQ